VRLVFSQLQLFVSASETISKLLSLLKYKQAALGDRPNDLTAAAAPADSGTYHMTKVTPEKAAH
jgi:hypothetical protein